MDIKNNGTNQALPDLYYADFEKAALEVLQINKVSKYAVPIVIGILFGIGLIGNILVVYVSLTTKRIVKHPVHSLLVLNLAVADIIYLVSSAPYQISSNISPRWIYGGVMCPVFHFLNILTMCVSIFTMCTLASLRFLALKMPFRMDQGWIAMSGNKPGCLAIFLVWIIATAMAIPSAYFYRLVLDNSSSPKRAVFHCMWTGDGMNAYSIALLVFTFILPLFLVLVLYIFIIRTLCDIGKVNLFQRKSSVKRSMSNGLSSSNPASDKSEYLRTTYMIFGLIGAFSLCWFPYHLYKMLQISSQFENPKYATMRTIMEIVGYCFSYAHACINPIIYTFAAPGFRKSIGKACSRHRLKKSFRIPRLTSNCWSKPTNIPSRRASHESTRMVTLTNDIALCNTKITALLNEVKGSNETSSML